VTPSKTEKKEWLIVRVSGLTPDQISLMMSPWQEQTGTTPDGSSINETKAYRRYKVDLDNLKLQQGITITTGLWQNKIDKADLSNQLKQKDQKDVISICFLSLAI
ncbi:MAG: hypothetical protein ABIH42_00810, partial [Planctomycetota bacterium]